MLMLRLYTSYSYHGKVCLFITDSALGKNNKVVKSNTRNYSTYLNQLHLKSMRQRWGRESGRKYRVYNTDCSLYHFLDSWPTHIWLRCCQVAKCVSRVIRCWCPDSTPGLLRCCRAYFMNILQDTTISWFRGNFQDYSCGTVISLTQKPEHFLLPLILKI